MFDLRFSEPEQPAKVTIFILWPGDTQAIQSGLRACLVTNFISKPQRQLELMSRLNHGYLE